MITANIASYLPEMARQQPNCWAVVQQPKKKQVHPSYKEAYTYQQLDQTSEIIANGLRSFGIKKGTRTVLMVKPGLDFFSLVFALFKIEAILVAVDPGMGLKNLGSCLSRAEPDAFIGIASAHIARHIFRWSNNTIDKLVLVGQSPFFSLFMTHLDDIKQLGQRAKGGKQNTKPEDTAAILFTSGSTGLPKGVVYTHANFTAQLDALKKLYAIQPGEIDLATFPLFALFAPALGMTSIIPVMNSTKPARVKPQRIVDAVSQYQCTTMFGSPALLNRVGRWAAQKPVQLPSLKRVLCAGAPVTPVILQRYQRLLGRGVEIFTPYGATEALPVSSIGSHEILTDTAYATACGKGICVGRPVVGLDIKIIEITDDAIFAWRDQLELNVDEIGEICVRGDQVSDAYYNLDQATRLAKITTENGFYHRMGDLGYRDKLGRIWHCGRKSQRVVSQSGTLFTLCCEGIFNVHSAIFRTALVGVGSGVDMMPVICVELEPANRNDSQIELTEALNQLAKQFDITKNIKHFLYHSGFPVDARHNAKIGREKLAVWAKNKLR